jgi:hypothetical protein
MVKVCLRIETLSEMPSVIEVRKRIAKAEPEYFRMILTDLYLKAGRISESISIKAPADTTTVYGPVGTDANIEDIEGHEAVVIQVKTAKRKGKERLIALPVETEPWAKLLYNYYRSFGDQPVFPFTRQYIWVKAKELFEGFSYEILAYSIRKDDVLEERPIHNLRATLHFLRHLRATELVRFYHFKAEDLAAYCGWKLQTVSHASSVMERYVDLGAYTEYFPKLLKKR